ncbi:hypothetical protein [Musicola paradisiaca]|uniref:Uncharacterized protein n=1 Tax=Musicola paradisiaca (strain Ech703) TaxID=579405 RepID=C6C2W5_MUSP7|nr:hypothetical protein [Musicola paradisiaca]ACS85230.1 hypothetical protein Dd703_1428 [Musicola paradisiaca Ech703]
MNEYLINSGQFNMIICPKDKAYYILNDDQASADTLKEFLEGNRVQYSRLKPLWFRYRADESWQDFDKKEYRLGQELAEAELIDRFVLKKFNFGSLVAVRDVQTGNVKVFKRDKLPLSAN